MSSTSSDGVLSHFKTLPSESRISLLKELIDACDTPELLYLQNKLPKLLFRDFIKLLPLEITEKILSYLDCCSLFSSAQVSKRWHSIISNVHFIWKAKAMEIGVGLPTNTPVLSHIWKSEAFLTCRIRAGLEDGSVFREDHHGERITPDEMPIAFDGDTVAFAVAYNHGSSVPNNWTCLNIWSLKENKQMSNYTLSTRTTVLKLVENQFVICGHSNGKITAIDLTGKNGGPLVFIAHSALIMSIDCNERLGLFATGSIDTNVKIWTLKTGEIRKVLSGLNEAVVSIIIKDYSQHGLKNMLEGHNVILIMTRNDIYMYFWKNDEDNKWSNLVNSMQLKFTIPLRLTEEWSLMDLNFTPGMLFVNQQIAYVKQLPMFDTQTVGEAEIRIADGNTGEILKTYGVRHRVRKLLGIGKRFALLLLPYVEKDFKNVVILDLNTSCIVGGFSLKIGRPLTPDLSQITLCDTRWLDGFNSGCCQDQPIMATTSVPNHNWHLIKWGKATEGRTFFET